MRQLSIISIIAILFISAMSVFVVEEGQRGMVLQLGQLKRDGDVARIYEPGIHFKVPFTDKLLRYDARIQTMDGAPERFGTSEKKDVIVDTYAKWRIKDFEQFYKSTGGRYGNAENLLQRKLDHGLRTEFGLRTIHDVVSGERDQLMAKLREQANSDAVELGIEIIDVRVKRINLPEQVSENVYARMRTERKRVATEHRSKGQGEAEKIKAAADAQVTVIIASAERDSKRVRGEGDALAAKTYADAYNKDREFFDFVRTLEAYKSAFANKDDVMVIKPDGDFFKYMKAPSLSEK